MSIDFFDLKGMSSGLMLISTDSSIKGNLIKSGIKPIMIEPIIQRMEYCIMLSEIIDL